MEEFGEYMVPSDGTVYCYRTDAAQGYHSKPAGRIHLTLTEGSAMFNS